MARTIERHRGERENRREAERLAVDFEDSLNNPEAVCLWADFVRRYKDEHLSGLSKALSCNI